MKSVQLMARKFISLDQSVDSESENGSETVRIDIDMDADMDDTDSDVEEAAEREVRLVVRQRRGVVRKIDDLTQAHAELAKRRKALDHEMACMRTASEAELQRLRSTVVPYPTLALSQTRGSWDQVFKYLSVTEALGGVSRVCTHFNGQTRGVVRETGDVFINYSPLDIVFREQDGPRSTVEALCEALRQSSRELHTIRVVVDNDDERPWPVETYLPVVATIRDMVREYPRKFHSVHTLCLPWCRVALIKLGLFPLLERVMPRLRYISYGNHCNCDVTTEFDQHIAEFHAANPILGADADEVNSDDTTLSTVAGDFEDQVPVDERVFHFPRLETVVAHQSLRHLFGGFTLVCNPDGPLKQCLFKLGQLQWTAGYDEDRAAWAQLSTMALPAEIHCSLRGIPTKFTQADAGQILFVHPNLETVHLHTLADDGDQLDRVMHRYGFRRAQTTRLCADDPSMHAERLPENVFPSDSFQSLRWRITFERSALIISSVLSHHTASHGGIKGFAHANGCVAQLKMDRALFIQKIQRPLLVWNDLRNPNTSPHAAAAHNIW